MQSHRPGDGNGVGHRNVGSYNSSYAAVFPRRLSNFVAVEPSRHTGYTQKNGAVSKVNKKFISHLTRAQRTPSAAANVKVSHALPAFRFSCLLRGRGANF